MVGCSVLGCKSRSERNISGITFHKFPSDVDIKLKWVVATGRKKWKPTKYTKMCSLHFSGDAFDFINQRVQIKKSSVPVRHIHGEIVYMATQTTAVGVIREVASVVSKCDIMSDQDYNDNTTEDIYPVAECRACLQILYSDSNLWNIFEPWTPPWDGMENTIAEDLLKLANIQISETDKHSKVICETCYQVLLGACHFTACVRKNDQILLERYPCESQPNLDDKVWPKPIQVDKTLHSSMFQNPMDIEVKQEVLSDDEYGTMNGTFEDNKDDIPNLDIKIEPEEIQQSIHVNVNGSTSPAIAPEQENQKAHVTNGNATSKFNDLRVDVKEEPLSDEDNDPLSSDLPLECLLCAKSFNSATGLKAHVIAQHSYKSVKRKTNNSVSPQKNKCNYICAICRRRFSTSTDLMVHETCHNKSVCYGCNQSFDTFAQLTKHRRTCKAVASQMKHKTLDDVLRPQTQGESNESKELQCIQCNETFSDIYYLKIHQEIHHCISSEDSKNEVESMEVESPKRICTRNKKS